MSDISERLVVHCPDREASHRLAAFIDEHKAGDGRVMIALRLPFTVFADRRAAIQRRIVATLHPLRSIGDPHPTYSVTWTSESNSRLPEFSGALAVVKSSLDDCVGLMVSGHYEPPFGRVGEMFDATFGRRIARAAARDLLETIAKYVEKAGAATGAARPAERRQNGAELSGR